MLPYPNSMSKRSRSQSSERMLTVSCATGVTCKSKVLGMELPDATRHGYLQAVPNCEPTCLCLQALIAAPLLHL